MGCYKRLFKLGETLTRREVIGNARLAPTKRLSDSGSKKESKW